MVLYNYSTNITDNPYIKSRPPLELVFIPLSAAIKMTSLGSTPSIVFSFWGKACASRVSSKSVWKRIFIHARILPSVAYPIDTDKQGRNLQELVLCDYEELCRFIKNPACHVHIVLEDISRKEQRSSTSIYDFSEIREK